MSYYFQDKWFIFSISSLLKDSLVYSVRGSWYLLHDKLAEMSRTLSPAIFYLQTYCDDNEKETTLSDFYRKVSNKQKHWTVHNIEHTCIYSAITFISIEQNMKWPFHRKFDGLFYEILKNMPHIIYPILLKFSSPTACNRLEVLSKYCYKKKRSVSYA